MIISSFKTSSKQYFGINSKEELSCLATSQSKIKPTIENENNEMKKTQSCYKIQTNESGQANVEKKLLYYVTAQNSITKKPLLSQSTAKFSSDIQIDRCRKFNIMQKKNVSQDQQLKKKNLSQLPYKQSLKEWVNENVKVQQMVNKRQHLVGMQVRQKFDHMNPITQDTTMVKRSSASINQLQQTIYLNRIKILSAKIHSQSPFQKQIQEPLNIEQVPSTADSNIRIKKFCYLDYPSFMEHREQKLNFQMNLQILNDDYAFCKSKGQENNSVIKLSQIYQNERLNKDYFKRRIDNNYQCIYTPQDKISFQMFNTDINPQNTEISCENIKTDYVKKRSNHRKARFYKDALRLNEL